ncbi:MAG: hypothetical protein EAZ85_03095 [Bacteroidetes bacterium]|nr:MAG: hypothetical protein EAZ85_03095 [Bacteroidota bacterium]
MGVASKINSNNNLKINIFFDKSASMGGYLTNGPKRGEEDDNFKNKVRTFLSYFSDTSFDEKLKIYLLDGGKVESYKNKIKSAGDLVGEFSDGMDEDWGFRNGKDTPIHTIFENIFKNKDTSSINIFFTESIMSYPTDKIKKEPYANQDSDGLKGKVTGAFAKYQKDFGISVYAFLSKFDGTYFNHSNQPESCCLTNLRPFYIWVIGRKSLMPKFTNYIINDKKFKAREELHIGWQYNAPKHTILSSEGRAGGWDYVDTTHIEKLPLGETIKFTIGLDLKSYPINVQDEKYLKENIEVDNLVKKESVIVKKQSDFFKTISSEQQNDLKPYTHFITLELNNNAISTKNTLSIKLKKKNSTWYEKWSTENDKDINKKENNKKTFAFKELIEGILEAYKQNEYYF